MADQHTATPDAYEVRDITIKTSAGKATIAATVYGALAIHPRWRSVDGSECVVTHVATGMIVVVAATDSAAPPVSHGRRKR